MLSLVTTFEGKKSRPEAGLRSSGDDLQKVLVGVFNLFTSYSQQLFSWVPLAAPE